MDTVEQIKSRLDVVDVIQDYLPLKKAGVNYKAPCPFHWEKTPSFVVSPVRQIWHCFGCSEGGDMFTFVQKMEGMEFADALRVLAQKAGVEIKRFKSKTRKGNYLDILEEASQFYHNVLKRHPHAQMSRDYLQKRKVTEDTAGQFSIGFAPPLWDSLINYLVAKRFSHNDIAKAGLLIQNEKGRAYDRFRSRLIFPIKNINGQIVGFGGRILGEKENESAKYINTPQTELYDKSSILYGLSDARFNIKEKNLAIIVEGYFDVVLSHQAGVKNVIAVSGTALTDQHIRILKRYTNTVALCFDADSAGVRATERSFAVALQGGMQVNVIQLPVGKDPADCVQENADIWKDAIKNAKKYLDYAFDKAFTDLKNNDITIQQQGISYMFNVLSNVSNFIDQMHYIKRIAQVLNMEDKLLFEEFQKKLSKNQLNTRGQYSQESQKTNNKVVLSPKIMFTQRILALMLLHYNQRLSSEIFKEPLLKYIDCSYLELYKILYSPYNNDDCNLALDDVSKSDNVKKQLDVIYLLSDDEYVRLTEKQREDEYSLCSRRLIQMYYKERLFYIQKELKEAELQKNETRVLELLNDFREATSLLNKNFSQSS